MDIFIRQERPEEYGKTEEMTKQAFSHEEYSNKKEHLLVRNIRKSDAFIPELSLVAINHRNELVGHILLSKITIVDHDKVADSLALAPVSVAHHHQNKGIGSQLIHAALEKAKEIGYHSVIVLGHKDYYPKFGFKRAALWNIKPPFEVPDEVFMAIELTERSLEHIEGVVHYSEAFSE